MTLKAIELVIKTFFGNQLFVTPLLPQLPLMQNDNFIRLLENLLEEAYQLQEESESLFIHENSILNRPPKRQQKDGGDVADFRSVASGYSRASGRSRIDGLLSVSSVDNESFVSAQDTIADLRDFDELLLGNDLSN